MNKLWLILTFGLMLALALQWMAISGVTLLAGGEIIFRDPAITLIVEFIIATLAAVLAIAGVIRYGRIERDR